MDYYSAIEKKKSMSFAAMQMDFEIVMLSELTQKEKDKCKWYHVYVVSEKGTNELIAKQK